MAKFKLKSAEGISLSKSIDCVSGFLYLYFVDFKKQFITCRQWFHFYWQTKSNSVIATLSLAHDTVKPFREFAVCMCRFKNLPILSIFITGDHPSSRIYPTILPVWIDLDEEIKKKVVSWPIVLFLNPAT